MNMKATDKLDCVYSVFSNGVMLTHDEVLDSMTRRLICESAKITENKAKMRRHEDSYNRFVDLKAETETRERRIQRLIGVIGIDRFVQLLEENGQAYERGVYAMDDPENVSKRLPLWHAVQEYLAITGEARITDIQTFLSRCAGIEATRQALESALNQHPETFKTVKHDREKYVSLMD